jgi:hypothetical protein
MIEASSPFVRTTGTRIRVFNVTSSTVGATGASTIIPNSTNAPTTRAVVNTILNPGVTTTYRIEYYAQASNVTTNGLGQAVNIAVSGNEVYTIVNILKLA